MTQPKEAQRNSSQHNSSSSSITMPPRDDDQNTVGSTFRDGEGSRPIDYLLVIWTLIVAFWKSATAVLYESTVNFVATFVADIISHPKVHTAFEALLVRGINAYFDQDDIGTKLDDTARRVIYDPEMARDASHALGKEVLPVVTGFIGGMASSLKPSEIKKRGKRRKEREISQRIEFSDRSGQSDEEEDEDLSRIKKSK